MAVTKNSDVLGGSLIPIRLVTESGPPASFIDISRFGNTQDLVWRPDSASDDSVIAFDFIRAITDSANGDITGTAHAIAKFLYLVGAGGGTIWQQLAHEIRYGVMDGTTVLRQIGTQHAFDTNAEVTAAGGGTVSDVATEYMADLSATSTWFTTIGPRWLDPRWTVNNAGKYLSALGFELSPPPAAFVNSRWYVSAAAGATSTGNVSRGLAIACPPILIPRRTSCNRLRCECTTAVASGTARLGLYKMDPATGLPGALVVDAGTVTLDATGVKTVSFTAVTLEPGQYFPVIQAEGGAADPGMRLLAPNDTVLAWQYGSADATPFGPPEDWLYAAHTGAFAATFGGVTRLRVGVFPAVALAYVP